MTGATRDVVLRHLDAWRRGDVDGIMQDYADDAVILVAGADPVVGKVAIRGGFEQLFRAVFPTGRTMLTTSDDVFFEEYAWMRWAAASPVAQGRNGTEFLRVVDGKIVCQTTAVDLVFEAPPA